jgi:hypothetical protein
MWPKVVLDMNIVAEKARNGGKSAFEKLYSLY